MRTTLALVTFGCLAACGGGEADTTTSPTPQTPVLATVTVALSATTISIGQSTTGTAAGLDQTGASIATGPITWSTSSSAIGSVSASGVVTAIGLGQAQVIASAGGKQGQALLTVVQVPVATVSLAPATASLPVGGTTSLTITVRDASNAVLTGRSVTWTSSNPAVATVSASGVVSGISAGGPVEITATSEGKSGTAQVTVTSPVMNLWSTVASMPTRRAELALGVINGIIYAVGGQTSLFGSFATLEAYDPTSNSWTTKASMPTPRASHAVGVVNGVLYAIGGSPSGGLLGTVEAYDPLTNTWTTKASMPTARRGLAVGVVNGIIYAVGGLVFTGSQVVYSNAVQAYDPVTNTWTTKASMPTGRNDAAIGVVNGIMYVVGGYNTAGGDQRTVEAYDPTTNSWTTKASMPTARYGPGIDVINGILYAVGGFGGGHVSTVEAYDPVANSWTTRASMPTARYGLRCATVNGVLYAIGGTVAFQSSYLGTVEAYRP